MSARTMCPNPPSGSARPTSSAGTNPGAGSARRLPSAVLESRQRGLGGPSLTGGSLSSASRLIAGIEEGEQAVGESLEPITTQVVEHVAPVAAWLEHAGVAQLA
jgi:hypothetical protein